MWIFFLQIHHHVLSSHRFPTDLQGFLRPHPSWCPEQASQGRGRGHMVLALMPTFSASFGYFAVF